MKGKVINSLSGYSDHWAMRDIFLTATLPAVSDRLMQGCDDQADPGNLTLVRSSFLSSLTT